MYYSDALSMSKDSLWFGYGGGGWSQLQYRYQTSDYFVRYIHNHFLQVVTDVGLIGAAVYVGVVVLLLYRSVYELVSGKGDKRVFQWGRVCICFALVVHSLVDFTFSYPYLLGLFLVLGVKRSANESEATVSGQVIKRFKVPLGILSVLIAAIIGTLFLSSYYFKAASKAFQENRPADAVTLFDKSIKTALFADQAHDQKGKIYFKGYLQGNDQRYLAVAEEENRLALQTNPTNIWYRKFQSDILWEQGSRGQSLSMLEELVEENPYRARWREELRKRGS
ncbi:O-antigen ligase family protein [Cohnella cholangitidis]|uniref:O-antigen ligase family protein n=1 Tax=Cohnella cholangitidis TaxID=2598458 RepID=A0A7G5BXX4_9BACL|nr:O-antigen ligase family protein [Cohnella cholangitidis]QMV41808.1 O-antigen ligase family protein [Cohnella cholangitidis]